MESIQTMSKIVAAVRELSIVEEIEKHMELPRREGPNLLGLCPFHNDTHMGSFKVNEKAGRYSCFACSAGGATGRIGGDLIDFRAKLLKMTYGAAALEIAFEHGIIDGHTYGRLKNRVGRDFEPMEVKTTEKAEKPERKQRHGVQILNAVYGIFLDCCDLSEKHRRDLKEKRYLTDEVIEERKYKTNTARSTQFMQDFLGEIRKSKELTGMSVDEILAGTPGFFQKKQSVLWKWTTHNAGGLLIPTMEETGQITGMQIRLDEKKDGYPRYIWFTSSFAETGLKDYYQNGTGSGISLDVIYPKNIQSKALFITEGRFKAEAVADKIGAVVISVPGVGNYRGIENMIKRVEEETRRREPAFTGFKNICVAYDSDSQTNDAVSKSRESMRKTIAKTTTTPIYYVLWDTKFKGIDDLLYSEEAEKAKDFRKMMRAEKK